MNGRLLALLALLACCGCWRNQAPGTIQDQRLNATLHDPYPDQNAGPEMVGVRPPSYDKPLAEPVRARGLRDSWWNQ